MDTLLKVLLNKILPMLMVIAGTVFSRTISGNLDTILLSPANNPYTVEKDLFIPKEKTVTIPEGCVFLFNPFCGIVVDGTLMVLGTAEQPVVFTSVNDSMFNKNSMRPPEPFDWNGILIGKNSGGTHLQHCMVQYAVYGVRSQTPDFTVDNGIFASNGQFHLTVNDSILDVKDELPYSYGSNDIALTISLPEVKPIPKPVIEFVACKPLPNIRFTSRQPVKYSALTLAVLGAGAGVFCAVKAGQHQSNLEKISTGVELRDKVAWNKERSAKWGYIRGLSISFAASLIGLSFFSIGLL